MPFLLINKFAVKLHKANYIKLFTFTVVIVRLMEISSGTLTIITTFCIVTDMGTSSIVIKTLINICNGNTTLICNAVSDHQNNDA